jgi:hypothetical protein
MYRRIYTYTQTRANIFTQWINCEVACSISYVITGDDMLTTSWEVSDSCQCMCVCMYACMYVCMMSSQETICWLPLERSRIPASACVYVCMHVCMYDVITGDDMLTTSWEVSDSCQYMCVCMCAKAHLTAWCVCVCMCVYICKSWLDCLSMCVCVWVYVRIYAKKMAWPLLGRFHHFTLP